MEGEGSLEQGLLERAGSEGEREAEEREEEEEEEEEWEEGWWISRRVRGTAMAGRWWWSWTCMTC